MATIKQIAAMSAAERDAANQAQLARLTDVPCVNAEFHSYALKHWQVKFSGPKPTLEMLKMNYIIDGGRRAGFEPMWLALTLRANGATVSEYTRHEYGSGACPEGAAHNNAVKYNNERGGPSWFVRVPLPNDSRAGRWQHVITDKGIAQLSKRIAALTGDVAPKAKPAKAVKVARKRNAKAAPAVIETPTNDAASVTEGTTSLPATVEALASLADHFNS